MRSPSPKRAGPSNITVLWNSTPCRIVLGSFLLACNPTDSCLRAMIANARRWALAKGLVRTNDVHGLEEYKIPTFEGFSFSNEASQQSKVKGTFEAEDTHIDRGLQVCLSYSHDVEFEKP